MRLSSFEAVKLFIEFISFMAAFRLKRENVVIWNALLLNIFYRYCYVKALPINIIMNVKLVAEVKIYDNLKAYILACVWVLFQGFRFKITI